MKVEKIAIIGVGFMGGSFALAVKHSYPHVDIFGVDVNPFAIEKGKSLKVIDKGSTDLRDIKSFEPELVLLATPVRTFISIAKDLKELINHEVVVTDLGSVKGHIVYAMEDILGERFVGGHPIAGTEKSGVEHSKADLYKGKKFIITPTGRTNAYAKEMVRELWEELGCVVEEMDPYLHDYIFGAVSHLPHAVAFALIDSLIKLSDSVDLFKYPGAGFKDFTRIAGSDPIMWRDIFIENKKELLKSLDVYMESLVHLKKLIEEERVEELTKYLQEARDNRLKIVG